MSRPLVPSRFLLSSLSRLLGSEHGTAGRPLSLKCLQNKTSSASSTASTTSRTTYSRHLRHSRPFSTSLSRASKKTIEEQRSQYRSGPFSWKAAVLFIASGAGLCFYFQYETERMQRQRVANAAKGVGKPKVGGPFQSVDQDGKPFTEQNMKGKYALVYFGFTHCPDICPDELDKMAQMIDLVEAERPKHMRPIFFTCDPARDTPAVIKEYLQEFHPSIIGLTGTYEQIKAVCKTYRVYFSTPAHVKPGQDYLVDHSIYFYLMDPEGDFVEAIGRQHSPKQAAKIILDHMRDWKGTIDKM